MALRARSRPPIDALPLHRADSLFIRKLEEILQASAGLVLTTGWKELANDIGIEAGKIHEWECLPEAHERVEGFIAYAIFDGPHRDELTVGRLERHARNIGNTRIVDAFAMVKEQIHRQGPWNGRPDGLDEPAEQQDTTPPASKGEEEPLDVYGLPIYRLFMWIAQYKHGIYPAVLAYCIVHFFHSIWHTNEHDRPYLHPDQLWTQLCMLHVSRVFVRSISHYVFASRLFFKNIASVPVEMSRHRLLGLLKNPRVLRRLLEIHGEPMKATDADLEAKVLRLLNEKLTFLCLGVLVFALFIPLFFYKAGGLTYASDYPDFWAAWEAFSFFTIFGTSGVACCFFTYEYRLVKYMHGLREVQLQGMAELEGVPVNAMIGEIRNSMIRRWVWLHIYVVLTILLFSGTTMAHLILDLPFTLSCLPFPANYQHRQWIYFIFIAITSSALTFLTKENKLRAARVAMCLICIPILLFRTSLLESFIGKEKVHLHVLLYAIPLVSLCCISWTLHRLHFIASAHSETQKSGSGLWHTVLSVLFTSLSALAFLSVTVAIISEYMFIRGGRNSLACPSL